MYGIAMMTAGVSSVVWCCEVDDGQVLVDGQDLTHRWCDNRKSKNILGELWMVMKTNYGHSCLIKFALSQLSEKF